MSGEAARNTSSLLPFFGTRLRRQDFNLAPTQYRQLRRLRDLLYRLQLLFLNRALIFEGIFSALQGVVPHQEDRKKSLQP